MFPQETQYGHILAVDDTLDNLLLFEVILESEGFQVSLAPDGPAALKQIEQSPPELILLDVMMPDMDGYEVTCRIRQSPHLPYIPILLVTAHDQSSVMRALKAGANDFIRKPFDAEDLLARIRSLMQQKADHEPLEQAPKKLFNPNNSNRGHNNLQMASLQTSFQSN